MHARYTKSAHESGLATNSEVIAPVLTQRPGFKTPVCAEEAGASPRCL